MKCSCRRRRRFYVFWGEFKSQWKWSRRAFLRNLPQLNPKWGTLDTNHPSIHFILIYLGPGLAGSRMFQLSLSLAILQSTQMADEIYTLPPVSWLCLENLQRQSPRLFSKAVNIHITEASPFIHLWRSPSYAGWKLPLGPEWSSKMPRSHVPFFFSGLVNISIKPFCHTY